jgi:uncharacterized protein (TIGR04255 family)
MSSSLQFDPIYPAHAIERCAVTVIFDQVVPQKILSSLRATHRSRLLEAGLTDGPPVLGMQIDISTGKVIPVEGDGPISFVTSNRGTTVTLAPNQINLTTVLYTRWVHFEATLDKILMPLVSDYSTSVSVYAVQLDYLDRFIWSGTWENFDAHKLLLPQGELVAARPLRVSQQWHCHSGWFETPTPGKRRLINVNLDIASAAVANSGVLKPSIGILTVMQDGSVVIPPHTKPNWFAENEIMPILRQQHSDLKDLLRSIISTSMAQQIGL